MQYRLLALILLVLSFSLNLKPVADSYLTKSIRGFSSVVAFPFYKGFGLFSGGTNNALLFFRRAYNSQKKIQDLSFELKKSKAEITLLNSLRRENDELRSALRFEKSGAYHSTLLPSNVIGREGRYWSSFILLDVGSNNGVRVGFSVIGKKGLVGKVVEVSNNSSKVMLITSQQSSVSVVVSRSGVYGIARGGYGNRLKLLYVPETASIEVDSIVNVSSSSTSYVPGVPVAKIVKVNKNFDNVFQDILIAPYEDLSKLGVVFVCKPY